MRLAVKYVRYGKTRSPTFLCFINVYELLGRMFLD